MKTFTQNLPPQVTALKSPPRLMRMKTKLILPVIALAFTFALLCASTASAAAIASAGSGNWSSTTANAPWPGGVVPTAADTVTIVSNHNVTNDIANAACASLNVAPINNNLATLTFNAGTKLTVTGAVTLGDPANSNRRGAINMTSGGTLVAGSLALGNAGANTFTPGTGTVELTGTATIPATIYTSFNNLIINGGTTTLGGSATVGGTLTLTSGALSIGANTLALNGTVTTTSGTLTGGTSSTIVCSGTTALSLPGVTSGLQNLRIANSGGVTLTTALAIDGTLRINSGVVTLNNVSTTTARQLSFAGVAQTAGTWGNTGSGAANIDATRFAGSGTVAVSGTSRIYRSEVSGNWDSLSTWQMSSDGGLTFGTTGAGGTPGVGDVVYIQSGHTVTLTQNEGCKDLHISTGTTGTGGPGGTDAGLALGASTLSINGKLRTYFSLVDAVAGGANVQIGTSATAGPAGGITITAASGGGFRFVGSSRNIVNTGEWSAFNTGATTTFGVEVAMNAGQTATMQTSIKASSWNISSGTLDTGANPISADNGTAGQGNITIGANGTVISSQSGSGSSSPVFLRLTTPTSAGTLTVNGLLQLSGASPSIAMTTVSLNGTVEYTRVGAQTLAVAAGSGAAPGTYTNLKLNGNGAKTLGLNTAVNGTLTMAGDATGVSLGLGAFTLTYGGSSTLEYAGAAAQTTATTEFPAAGGPNSLKINNASGVSLAANRTVAATTILNLAKLNLNTSTLGGPVTVQSGGTLSGSGTSSGTVTVDSGGIVSPGTSVGTIHFGSQPTLNGTLAMEIDKTTPANSDKLILDSGVFAYGGTLALTVTAGTLSGGELFDLFDFTGTSSGSFAITTSPTLAAGLNWWQGNLATTGTILLNRAPVAGSHTVTTRTNQPLDISLNKLKAADSDPDGDTLSITSVGSAQPGDATVSLGTTTITYTPGTTAGAGSFEYTLSDGRGGTATVTVSVTIEDSSSGGVSPNVVYGPLIDGTDFVVRFAGIPGQAYTVEHSTSATGPWSKLANYTAPADNSLGFGIGVFEVRENTSGSSAGFYRTVYPSY